VSKSPQKPEYTVFFDTNFLIYLAKPSAPEYPSALKYYQWLKENNVPMLTSVVCVAEFAVKGNPDVIPRDIEVLALEIHHAKTAGKLASIYYQRSKKDKACIADDLKIVAQAQLEKATHLLSHDRDMMKICEHLKSEGIDLPFSLTDPITIPAESCFGFLEI